MKKQTTNAKKNTHASHWTVYRTFTSYLCQTHRRHTHITRLLIHLNRAKTEKILSSAYMMGTPSAINGKHIYDADPPRGFSLIYCAKSRNTWKNSARAASEREEQQSPAGATNTQAKQRVSTTLLPLHCKPCGCSNKDDNNNNSNTQGLMPALTAAVLLYVCIYVRLQLQSLYNFYYKL